MLESLAREQTLEKQIAQRTAELQARTADLQNFHAAMNASADAIYLVDRASMRFFDVNDAACRMQSRTREELCAMGPDEVLSLPRVELERTYDSIIAGGAGTEPVEMLRERKDGSQVWVELRRRAQRSDNKWMIVTTVRDITTHKQTEQAWRESTQQLRLFADNVPAMTSAFDNNLRLVFVNRRYVEFFGHGKTDLVGLHLREVVGERAYAEIEGYFVQTLQGARRHLRKVAQVCQRQAPAPGDQAAATYRRPGQSAWLFCRDHRHHRAQADRRTHPTCGAPRQPHRVAEPPAVQ